MEQTTEGYVYGDERDIDQSQPGCQCCDEKQQTIERLAREIATEKAERAAAVSKRINCPNRPHCMNTGWKPTIHSNPDGAAVVQYAEALEQEIEQLMIQLVEARTFIKEEYNKFYSHHPYCHALRKRFSWLDPETPWINL